MSCILRCDGELSNERIKLPADSVECAVAVSGIAAQMGDSHVSVQGAGWNAFLGEARVPVDGTIANNDQIYFGFVKGDFPEYGYFSEGEHKSIKWIWEIPKENIKNISFEF